MDSILPRDGRVTVHYRTLGERPCEAVITINGVPFRCPRAGYFAIQDRLLCSYCFDAFKCNEVNQDEATETNNAKAM